MPEIAAVTAVALFWCHLDGGFYPVFPAGINREGPAAAVAGVPLIGDMPGGG